MTGENIGHYTKNSGTNAGRLKRSDSTENVQKQKQRVPQIKQICIINKRNERINHLYDARQYLKKKQDARKLILQKKCTLEME